MQNITEFGKFWMDISNVGQHSYIKTQYGLVFVNIKPQNVM